jgi:hypothetical protein
MIFQTMICSGGMATRPRGGKRDVYDRITIIHDTMEKLCSAGFAFSRSGDPRLFDKLGRGRCRIQVRRSSCGFA